MMRALQKFCAVVLTSLVGTTAQAAVCTDAWPDWQRFAERWVQSDGRVLESSLEKNHSTSEGQSYALFFALVANDQARFDAIWRWSRENLAGNDLQTALPAWLWGQGKDGRWQVQDANSASDADLWFAYALLEAARLWGKSEYQTDAGYLLARVRAEEVAELPGLGQMLLPGPEGFAHADHLWRLNPSYMPLPLLRRLARFEPQGPWQAIAENTVTLVERGADHGFIADWLGYRGTSERSGLFVSDPLKGDIGSHDAIRVYLWAGITDKGDPLRGKVLASLSGMAKATGSSGLPPEKVAVGQGRTEGAGPFGFSAALVPYFHAAQQPWLAELQHKRARGGLEKALATERKADQPPVYYDYMLSLFGLGWAQQRYRFDADGNVHTFWESPCSATTR